MAISGRDEGGLGIPQRVEYAQPVTQQHEIGADSPQGDDALDAPENEPQLPASDAVTLPGARQWVPRTGDARPRLPWILRARILYPLTILLGLLLGGFSAWYFSPVDNDSTGEREHRGAGLDRTLENVFRPKASLRTSFQNQQQISLLFVGLDNVFPRKGEDANKLPRRSDSVMLVRADLETKQVKMLSIPRDGWVELERTGKSGKVRMAWDRLAHSYSYGMMDNSDDPEGGIKVTKGAVEHLTGIPVQYYVIVKVDGFVKLIDALGGIEIDVEKRLKYRDRAGKLNIDLQPGLQHLNGEQAMGYARYRHDAVGDIGRMDRQQKVIKAIAAKLREFKNVTRLAEIAGILQEAVKTNLQPDQLLALAQHADEFPADSIRSQTLQSYWNQEPGHHIDLPGAGRGEQAQWINPKDADAATQWMLDLTPPPPPPAPAEEAAGEGDAAAGGASSDAPESEE